MMPAVCFLSRSVLTEPLPPSIARKFELLARSAKIFVIAESDDGRWHTFREHAQVVLHPRPSSRPARVVTGAIRACAALARLVARGEVQVVIAQSPYEAALATVVRAGSSLTGRRFVLATESHGDFAEALFAHHRVRGAATYRVLMRFAARLGVGRADILRAVSEATGRQLRQIAPRAKLFCFPAWTELGPFQEAGNAGVERGQEIGFAGKLVPCKGVDVLLHAFSRLASSHPRARLWLAGEALDESYRAGLVRLAEGLGVGDRVTFMGHISQSVLAARMAAASVVVLPSRSEGLGRVVLEAMAAGTPVVGAHVGGIPELIDDGVNGWLVPPSDAEALRERLAWVLDNPDAARRAGCAARTYAVNRFSPEVYARGYEQVFSYASMLLRGPSTA